MKHIFLFILALFVASFSKAQLVINEVSQGTSGNKEYIELVVKGTRSCTDTAADLRGWIIDDNSGWYGTGAISQGCYRLANIPSWSHVPYGSIILIYNDGDKNGLITQPDDPTDADNNGVYIVPITAAVIELNGASPASGSGPSYTYPATGFGASTSWTPMALNNNGDAVSVIKPTALNIAYHSMTYGNISGGTVHVNGSGGQKVYYLSNAQYASSAAWVSGSAPSDETPGAPNSAANAAWINGMKMGGSGAAYNDTTKKDICQGAAYTFNGNSYTNTGTYSFAYTTPGGCDSIITLKLTVYPVPVAPVVTSPLSFCQEDMPTALTATGTNLRWYTSATGGTGSPAAPIPVTTTVGNTVYYVSQTQNGCESPRSNIAVNIKPKPLPPVVTTPLAYCQRAQAVALAALGQNLQWYTVAAGGTPVSTAPVPPTAVSGTFSWFVSQKDNGCESNRSEIDVTVNEIVAAFTYNKDTVCAQDTLKLSSTSAGNALTYNWQFGDGATNNTAATNHIYTQEGNYRVVLTVTNAAGCTDSAFKRITILPLPVLSFTLDHKIFCQGEGTHINGSVSPYFQSIHWDFGDGTQAYSDQIVQHSYDTSGTFIIALTTTNKGCPDRTFSDTVLVHPFPQVNIGRDTAICPGNVPLQLINLAPVQTAVNYTWSTGETATGIAVREPGTYWLQLSNGQCSSTDSMVVARSCYIDIPNSFTPNSDGLNDYFFPRQFLSRALTAFSMQVFNRWGQVIFETKEVNGRGWDGQFNGLGQPQGVYIYLITADFENGVHERDQGNVTLLR